MSTTAVPSALLGGCNNNPYPMRVRPCVTHPASRTQPCVALPQLSQPNILACDQLLSLPGGPLDTPDMPPRPQLSTVRVPPCGLCRLTGLFFSAVYLATWSTAWRPPPQHERASSPRSFMRRCRLGPWVVELAWCGSCATCRRRLGAAPSGYASFKLRARHSGALVFPTVGYPLHNKRPPFFFLLVPKEAT